MDTKPQITAKPFISIVLAAYNEETILEKHLGIFTDYMRSLQDKYDWEIVLINDGSKDDTGEIADSFAENHPNVHVYHHQKNLGLGKALQDAFALTKGDYVVVLDIDLSFSPDHIEKLLNKMQETNATLVIASHTMKGAQLTKVPWYRKILSLGANKFLSLFTRGDISNLTSMARAYDGPYIRSLSLRSRGMEIMPEIIYKTMIMDEKIEQIPAHLDWSLQMDPSISRRSSMKIFHHTIATLLTGFLLRPFLFFILPGLLLFLFSFYPNIWMLVHFSNEFAQVSGGTFLDQASQALEIAYQKHPHTFLVGLLSLLLSIQLIALGFQSMQSKHYYEEIFNLATKIYRKKKKKE